MSCQDDFLLIEGDENKCKSIRRDRSNCECENETVSAYSPGVVLDKEEIARSIYSPIHIDLDGNFLPTIVDDAANKGMSVNRHTYISPSLLIEYGKSKAEHDREYGLSDRNYFGYASANCDEIRKLVMNDRRVCCIYDTATQSNISHADICYNFYEGRATKKKLRKALFELFENNVTHVAPE